MKNRTRWRGNRDGAAALTVLGFIVVICAVLAMMATAAVQRSYMARKLTDRVRALMYAEAGANIAYTVLEADWSQRTNAAAFPVTLYDMGSYDVTVTPTNNMAIIRSRGYCRSSDVAVTVDIANYGTGGSEGQTWDNSAFEYGILCGSEFDFSGCGSIEGTNGTAVIHANGNIFLRGSASSGLDIRSSTQMRINNNVTIDGDVTAPTLKYKANKVTITGTASEEAVPFVSVPDIDLTPYYQWAQDHGQVYNGFSASGGTYTPNGGLIWVQGSVHLSSHTVFNGTIIATGDIHISGQVDLTAGDTGFALVSRDGDIRYTTSGTVEGIIYARAGDFDHTANGQLIGKIVVGGDIKKAGCSGIFAFTDALPTLPGQTDPTDGHDIIGVSAWQE